MLGDDPFGGPLGARPVGVGNRMHRLLRGRYIVVVLLALVGAAAGAVLGYRSQVPEYRSEGYIEIRPTMNSGDLVERVQPMYATYMKSQAMLLTDRRVVRQAMESEDWRGLRGDWTEVSMASFVRNLDATFLGGSTFLRVTFTDADPKAAAIAVREVIKAYMSLYGDQETKDAQGRLRILDAEQFSVRTQISGKMAQQARLSEPWGGAEVDSTYSAMLNNIIATQRQLDDAELALRMAYNARAGIAADPDQLARIPVEQIVAEVLRSRKEAATQPGMAREPMTIDQMSLRYPELRTLINGREQLRGRRSVLLGRVGPEHPQIKDIDQQISEMDRRIEEYAELIRREMPGVQFNSDGTAATVTADAVVQHALRYHFAKAKMDREQSQMQRLAEARNEIRRLRIEIDREQARLNDLDSKIKRLQAEVQFASRVTVRSEGNQPVAPTNDRRVKYGAVFGFAGFAVPVVLGLLWGLLDRRYRYSDDGDVIYGGVQLLGVLPNLPDRMTDPAQASVAAHCVHQIRTMLQVGGGGEGRSVFAITSASPGDGKTSLSLALGLSFAAAGVRTLLIDADVVGGGLSARMNVSTADGILEALVNRSLLDYVRPTDVADLAILPVGNARAQHAPAFSPQAVRRLVMEARKHFEAVVIDTGPVLGSIEASPACVSADATVLVVARGQQRSMVERALNHLRVIGARNAGVVFNRAQASDFAHSVSRFSARSVSDLPATREGAPAGMDPVTRAVAGASSVRAGDNNGHGAA